MILLIYIYTKLWEPAKVLREAFKKDSKKFKLKEEDVRQRT